jgi:hypothetical protein
MTLSLSFMADPNLSLGTESELKKWIRESVWDKVLSRYHNQILNKHLEPATGERLLETLYGEIQGVPGLPDLAKAELQETSKNSFSISRPKTESPARKQKESPESPHLIQR